MILKKTKLGQRFVQTAIVNIFPTQFIVCDEF